MHDVESFIQIKSHVCHVFIYGWDLFKWIATMFLDRPKEEFSLYLVSHTSKLRVSPL